MSISVFQTVFYGCAEAIHLCFSSPIEIWKGVVVFQSIQLFVRGHFLPIQPSDVFTPTQHLPDKTLNLRKGNDIWLFSISVNRMGMMLNLLRKINPEELAAIKTRAYEIIANPDAY